MQNPNKHPLYEHLANVIDIHIAVEATGRDSALAARLRQRLRVSRAKLTADEELVVDRITQRIDELILDLQIARLALDRLADETSQEHVDEIVEQAKKEITGESS